MQGTSPAFGASGAQPSSSFHSSSYLPKLEANFMRDFTCCGKTLPNLHDLLQHYEEAHTQPSPNTARNNAFGQFGAQMGMPGSSQMSSSRTTPTPGQGNMQGLGQQPGQPQGGLDGVQMNALSANLNDDMDAVADMEMDDAIGTMELDDSSRMTHTRQMFGQQQRPQLDMSGAGFPQALRTSQPTTPAVASFGLQNNPTVSSVNTPTLTTQQQQQLSQGGSQMNDMDEMEGDLPGMPMGGNGNSMGDMDYSNGNPDDEDSNFCINDPGKHLFSPNGAFPPGNRTIQAQLAQLGLTQGQFADPETNKMLLQRLQSMMMPEEHKPFKCPVIGCEKAYKNQNGLKCVPFSALLDAPHTNTTRQISQGPRSPDPAASRKRGRYILHCQPGDQCPVSRNTRHGEGEAFQLRDLWQALQEPQRSQIRESLAQLLSR